VFANVFGSNFVIDNVHIDEPFPNEKYSREKFTFQISDHLLIWIGIKTDIEGLPPQSHRAIGEGVNQHTVSG
jgi:hypothetical protein